MALIAVPAGSYAQRISATLDAGAVSVGYADSVHQRAISVAPMVQLYAPWGNATAAGLYAKDGSGSWTTQGNLGVSLFTPLLPGVRWLRGELAPSAGGSAHRDGTRTGELLLQGRLHLVQSAWGIWLGGGAGETWDGAAWHRLTTGDAGIWGQSGAAQLVAEATPTAVHEGGGATPIRYTDIEGTLRWTPPRLTINTSLGTRVGQNFSPVPGSSTTWGNVSAAFWILRSAAVVVSGGNYPIDFTQGFPGGHYASIGIRLAPGRRGRARVEDALGSAGRGESGTTRFTMRDTVDPAGRRLRLFRVYGVHLTHAEIAGDFTNWQPVALRPAGGGWWSVTLPVAPGVHQVALRMNGGAWIAPPGLTRVSDEFGGAAGVMVVP